MSTLLLSFLNIAIFAGGWLAIHALARRAASPLVLGIAAVVLAAAAGPVLLKLSEPAVLFSDYKKAYYPAAQIVVGNPAGFAEVFEKGVFGFVNLPIVAYAFVPFYFLGEWLGVKMFALLGLAMTFATWVLLVRLADLGDRERWVLFLLFATNGPLYNSVKEANTTHMVLFALVLGLHLLRRRRDAAAGAVLGLATLIKLPLLLLGAYFVLRGRWRAASGFALVCAIAGVLSLLVFGWDTNVIWFEKCVLRFNANAMGAFNAQSVSAFFVRLQAGPDVLINWQPQPPGALVRFATTVLVALVYLAVFLSVWRGPGSIRAQEQAPQQDLEYMLVIVLALVTSPVSWSHYYCWLLLPAAFLLRQGSLFAGTRPAERLAWAAVVLAMPAVVLVQPSDPVFMTFYAKFAVSHYLYAGLVWLALLAWSRTGLSGTSPAHPPPAEATRLAPARDTVYQ